MPASVEPLTPIYVITKLNYRYPANSRVVIASFDDLELAENDLNLLRQQDPGSSGISSVTYRLHTSYLNDTVENQRERQRFTDSQQAELRQEIDAEVKRRVKEKFGIV